MNADLEKLIELEKVDREANRLSEEVAGLPKRVAAIEEKLAEHKAAVEKAKAGVKGNEANRRQLEADIKGFQEKIAKYRSQSSNVKTNEEYRALMHEVEFAEKQISTCEDKILELMLGLEAELKTESTDVEKEKAEAHVRTAEDEKLLAGLKEKRTQLTAGVNESTMAHYDRVMRQRKSAIAEARDQKCMSCFVMMRPQTWQELRTNNHIITCNSCGRILFFDPASEAAAPPPEPAKKKKSKARAAKPEVEAETVEAETESEVTPTQ
jgi:predicted  nucleic acid-binding Zn-ribbon protein